MAKLSKSQLSNIRKQVKKYKDVNSISVLPSKKSQIRKAKKSIKKNTSINKNSKKVTWSIEIGDLVEHRNCKSIVVELIFSDKSNSAIIVNSKGSDIVDIKKLKKI